MSTIAEKNAEEWRAEAKRLESAIIHLAAECHRAKWQFDLSEDFTPSKTYARALIRKGFDELHRIGDIAIAQAERWIASQENRG